MKESLSSTEWTLLGVFLILITTLVFIAKFNAIRARDTIGKMIENKQEILVTIEGAVKKPGEYRVEAGVPVQAVLKKAKLSPYADLKQLPLKKIIQSPLNIKVEELRELNIRVEGEILESLDLVMPVGSRISDLKSKVACTSETDKRFFRRRKLLRDGDKICVPKKTLEQNKSS